MFKKFLSLTITIILVVTTLEFSIYANKQAVTRIIAEPVTDTLDTPIAIDTLYQGTLTITALSELNGLNDTTITITVNTANYQADDNMSDDKGNSSTAWTGDELDYWLIKTNNSTITYIADGDYNWYKVTSILYEIK